MASLSLEEKITILHGDLRDLDYSVATVIILYLLPESIELIKPKLLNALQSGTVVICNSWGLKELQPKKKVNSGFTNNASLYLYDKSSVV